MRIQNSNAFTTFQVNHRPQNNRVSSVVQDLNAKAAKKNSSFDIAEISLRAKQLKQAETDEKLLKQKDSPHNGSQTLVEWAKDSLTMQKTGVNAVKNALLFARDRLENKMGEISKFDGDAGGKTPNSAIPEAIASGIAEGHKVSVTMNFAELVGNTVKFYNWQVEASDKASNGLASQVMENELEKISAQSLGLADLSKDPVEIMKALDSAIERLQDLSNTIEDRFYQASGEHMRSEPHEEGWAGMLEMKIQTGTQADSNQSVRKLKMTKGIEIQELGDKSDFNLTGDIFQMDTDFPEKMNPGSNQ